MLIKEEDWRRRKDFENGIKMCVELARGRASGVGAGLLLGDEAGD